MKLEKNYGGFWMLAGLVALLAFPMVIGHFALSPASNPTLHAEAISTSAN